MLSGDFRRGDINPATQIEMYQIRVKFSAIEIEFCIQITHTIIYLSKKFELILYTTFSKMCNYETAWPDLCILAGGSFISLLVWMRLLVKGYCKETSCGAVFIYILQLQVVV